MNERSGEKNRRSPFTSRVIVTGVALTVLFSVLAPQSSEPLTFLPRTVFWALHIGLGLTMAAMAARLMVSRLPGVGHWPLVLMSGLGGVLLFAPVAYSLEMLFPLTAAEPDNDWADKIAQTSTLAAIAIEALEMAPSYLSAWALIHLPALGFASVAQAVRQESPATNAFLERLPPAIGRDVFAVSSDLHYLQVTTREGQATILGALKEVEQAFGDGGLRVHRSHWVARDAVVRLRKAGSGWRLELIDGHRVPISRRKRREVLAQLGEDFVRASSASG